MDVSDFIPFRGNLDPRAQEFFPRNPYSYPFLPSLQFYYPYNPHPSPPPPPPPPPQYGGEVLGYPQIAIPAYSAAADPPFPAPCPPPPSSIPTRTVLVSMVPHDVSESLVRRELELFGDVRAVQMERIRDGIVTVHFYDLRHAQAAVAEIKEQHMQQQFRLRRHYESGGAAATVPPPLPAPAARGLIAGRAVWAQFIIPVTCCIPGGNNQGTLVLLNLDPDVSANHLKDIFRTFGPVKELRETPMKRRQKFVEFYDVRDAANALVHMNRKEINGKPVVIEFSRPGGNNNRRKYQFSRTPPSPAANAPPPAAADSLRIAIRNDGYFRSNNSKKNWRKGSKKSLSLSPSSSSSSSNQRGRAAGKPWKKMGGNDNNNNNNDSRFMINGDEIKESSDFRDSRTTVMIKNIPNKYSQKLLLNMLDNHCIHCNQQVASAAVDGGGDGGAKLSSYDFVYLPIDFINKCNVGYGFVNMTSPEAAWRLYKAFHLQTWEAFNSRKICEVTYARIQGIEALKEHFKNSRFPCEAEEYMPVVFSPPRDGRTLTAPLPIFGLGENPPSPSTTVSTSKEEEEEGDENLAGLVALLALNDDGDTCINEDEVAAAGRDGGVVGGDCGDFDGNDEGDGN